MMLSTLIGTAVGVNTGWNGACDERREAAEIKRHHELLAAITGRTVREVEADIWFSNVQKKRKYYAYRSHVRVQKRTEVKAEWEQMPLSEKIKCALFPLFLLSLTALFILT